MLQGWPWTHVSEEIYEAIFAGPPVAYPYPSAAVNRKREVLRVGAAEPYVQPDKIFPSFFG